jgi:hypothetical protein
MLCALATPENPNPPTSTAAVKTPAIFEIKPARDATKGVESESDEKERNETENSETRGNPCIEVLLPD